MSTRLKPQPQPMARPLLTHRRVAAQRPARGVGVRDGDARPAASRPLTGRAQARVAHDPQRVWRGRGRHGHSPERFPPRRQERRLPAPHGDQPQGGLGPRGAAIRRARIWCKRASPPSEDSAPSATLEARGASLRRLSSLGSSPQLAPKMASCRYRAPGVRGLRLRPLDQRQLSRRWYTAPSQSMHVGPPARRLAPAPSLARRSSPQAAPRARSWSMASMESTRTSARRATTSTTSITPRRGGAAGSRRALPAPLERRAS